MLGGQAGSPPHYRFIESAKGDALYTLGQHSNGTVGVFGVAISPDNRLLATAAERNGEVKIWDLDSRRLIETPEANGACMSVAFSPDGKLLAFGTGERGVKVWDVQEHREITQFPGEHLPGFGVPAFGFSPSGGQLAIGAQDGPVVLWDLATHTAGLTLKGLSLDITCLVFSRDGQTLVTGGDHTIRVWSLTNGQEITVFTNHTGNVQCVALSTDRRTVASGSWDRSIRIGDLPRQRQVTVLTNHTRWVSALAFSPDGKTLASASADDQALGHAYPAGSQHAKGQSPGWMRSSRSGIQ